MSATGFSVAWEAPPAYPDRAPVETYAYGICETESRNGIAADSQSSTSVRRRQDHGENRERHDDGDRGVRFGVAAVNARGQSDWSFVDVYVPEQGRSEALTAPASLSVTEGSSASYTVRLTGTTSDVTLSVYAGYVKDAFFSYACSDDCLLSSANNYSVRVTVTANRDFDNNHGVIVLHHYIESGGLTLSGRSTRIAVSDRVYPAP